MKKIKMFLFMIGTALLLTALMGCTSGGYYSSSVGYSYGNSWDYDRYYRSGVDRHYYRSDVRRSTNSVNRSRAVHRSGGGRRR